MIKHIHNNPEYEAAAHFMHVTHLFTASCGIIAIQCIIYYSVGFSSGKELLCWKCVINYEVRSAILWDGNSYHHCPADTCRLNR